MEENNNENNIDIPQATRPFWMEILLSGLIIVILSLVACAVTAFFNFQSADQSMVHFTYSANSELIFNAYFGNLSVVSGLVATLIYLFGFYFIRPSGIKAHFLEDKKYALSLSILAFFGFMAYFVIAIFLSGLSLPFALASFVACGLVGVYDYLIYKLYMEKRTLSNEIFWEIFRFAIVGLVAAVFDFATCTIFQFLIFSGSTAPYVTGISTFAGFVIGVIINYLMSTYMVYKAAKSNFSKSIGGMVVFLVLSAIGLGIGIGIQYLLYDCLNLYVGIAFFTYPVDFVIRTLVVMVYNYLTRKFFIYK